MFIPKAFKRKTTEHVWFIPSGATAKDMYDAMHVVNQWIEENYPERKGYDDSWHMRAVGDPGDEGFGFEIYVRGLTAEEATE